MIPLFYENLHELHCHSLRFLGNESLQGVLLSHAAVVSVVVSQLVFIESLGVGNLTQEDAYFSFLPLARIFDRCVFFFSFSHFFLHFFYLLPLFGVKVLLQRSQ